MLDPTPLRQAFGWDNVALDVIHTGENTVWRARLENGQTWVARVYRPGRRTRAEVEAEWAWARALSDDIDTPQPLLDDDGRACRDLGRTWAVAMHHVRGRSLDLSSLDNVRELGRVAGTLRGAAERIAATQPPGWVGFGRPRTDADTVLGIRLPTVYDAAYLTDEQRRTLVDLAGELERRLQHTPLGPSGWVHADLHPGNVLRHRDRTWVLDLDDAVWGPPDLEWATPRTHLRARTDLSTTWPVFLDGVGRPLDPERVRLATALYLIDTMAEFPRHLDLIALADPTAVTGRYLDYLQAELRSEG